MLLLTLSAFAQDAAPAPVPPVEVAAPAPLAPFEVAAPPRVAPDDPRRMRLAVSSVYQGSTPEAVSDPAARFHVMDGDGRILVDVVAERIGDSAVLAKRKKERTTGWIIVGSSLVAMAGGAAMYLSGVTDEDPSLDLPAAVLVAGGGVGTALGVGSMVANSDNPEKYWNPTTLRPLLDAWNDKLAAEPRPAAAASK